MSRFNLFIAQNAMTARFLGIAFGLVLAHFGIRTYADPLMP